ncbi:MAG: hypothetical protein IPI67_09390 [Myxococcales bacterium]|nr:hypothetical protein [Myxococcales bacterium]
MTPLGRRPLRHRLAFAALLAGSTLSMANRAAAQEKKDPLRDARLNWNYQKTQLYIDVSFRDVVDAEIRKKLSRGLPTTIVLTGTVYQVGKKELVSTTAQTCKITWHVWDEVYLVETTRPGGSGQSAALTVDGVIRRCAEARRLPIGTSDQVDVGRAVYVTAKIQVNPVSPEVLNKIKRWVSRPTGTGTAAPGDALFSTFTGLFLQRIGDAERELKFTTKSSVPTVDKPPPPKDKK